MNVVALAAQKSQTPESNAPRIWPDATHTDFAIRENGEHPPSLWRKTGDGWRMVCGGIWVTGQSRDTEGNGWCHIVEFIDQDGKLRQWQMPRSLLVGERTELLRQILDKGLFIVPDNEVKNDLLYYLSHGADKRYTSVMRTGWHDGSFVLPDQTIGKGDHLLINPPPMDKPSGTLESWRENVSRRCIGNSRLLLAVSAALTSPLLELSGFESGGVHFVGKSSQGKTKALQVARSTFGTGLQSWRATDNGLEGIAARHSDIGLCLDDIGQIDPRMCGAVAYMLGNGQGKARSHRDGTDRRPQTWRLIYLSTGEVSLAEHMAAAPTRAKPGQEVRMINIEADAGQGKGLFEQLHDASSAKQFADALGEAAQADFGHAGPAFIKYIVEYRDRCTVRIKEILEEFVTKTNTRNADGQVQRVATRLALIAAAGELASDAGITGWPRGEALDAAVKCFESWQKNWSPEGSREAEQAIEHARAFIQTQAARFENGENRVTQNRAGFNYDDEHWIFPSVFRSEVCDGMRFNTVKEALIAAGFLMPDNEGKHQALRSAEGKRQRFYVINNSIVEGADDELSMCVQT